MSRQISCRPVERFPGGEYPAARLLPEIRVDLELLDPQSHAAELYRISHQDQRARSVWTYLPEGPFDDKAKFDEWLTDCSKQTNHVFYATRDKESGLTAGMASYLDIQPAMGLIELGYIWFAPFLQKTATTTEALFLMLCYAMDNLGYRRMQWRCNSMNEKSRKAATRLGYTFEGIFYQHMIVKGRNRDTAWYSITDQEWPAIRSNIETWLSPNNFHENGSQKQSLSELNSPG